MDYITAVPYRQPASISNCCQKEASEVEIWVYSSNLGNKYYAYSYNGQNVPSHDVLFRDAGFNRNAFISSH